ncbi:MAG: hypothetical protein IJ566_02870 [Cardiobacteriaceae bacterium]|nr:hypothetical protein [Cardiobacteriaceae bacterium]
MKKYLRPKADYNFAAVLISSCILAFFASLIEVLDKPKVDDAKYPAVCFGFLLAALIVYWRELSYDYRGGRTRALLRIYALIALAVLYVSPLFDGFANIFSVRLSLFIAAAFCVFFCLNIFDECKYGRMAVNTAFHRVYSYWGKAALFYGLSFLLSAAVFGLGFALLYLIGFKFWDLPDALVAAAMGFFAGLNLLIFELLDIQPNEQGIKLFAWLQAVLLLFIGIYLFASIFVEVEEIKSGIRLTAATVLIALLLLAGNPQMNKLNLFSICAGFLLLLISLYGILVRIDARGITMNRIYFLSLLLAVSVLYIASALDWKLQQGGKTGNFAVFAVSVFAVCAIFNCLMPAKSIELAAILRSYTVDFAATDREYIYWKDKEKLKYFGRDGEEVVRKIAQFHGKDEIIKQWGDGEYFFKLADKSKDAEEKKIKAAKANIVKIPADLALSDTVWQNFYKESRYCLQRTKNQAVAIATDADGDGKRELLLGCWNTSTYALDFLFYPDPERTYSENVDDINFSSESEFSAWLHRAERTEITYTTPPIFYDNAHIAGKKIELSTVKHPEPKKIEPKR